MRKEALVSVCAMIGTIVGIGVWCSGSGAAD
jgi:hypothetical protein